MGLLLRIHGVTFRDNVRSCEIRKALNAESLILRMQSSQPYVVSTMCPDKSCWLCLNLLLTVRYLESS